MFRSVTRALGRLQQKKKGIRLIRIRRPFAAIVPKGFDARKDTVLPELYERGRIQSKSVPRFGYHKVTVLWETSPEDERYPNHVVTENAFTGSKQLIPRSLIYHAEE